MKSNAIGLTRRQLLASVACLAATSGILLADPAEHSATRAKAKFLTLISDRQSARAIGQLYISEHPDESDPDHLFALLRRTTALNSEEIVGSTKSRLNQELRNAFARDFEQGRVTSLRGWTVSLTEARLCAFVSTAA